MKRLFTYKNALVNVHQQVYELYANISHEIILGNLDEDSVKWILDTLGEIEDFCYCVEVCHEKNSISC